MVKEGGGGMIAAGSWDVMNMSPDIPPPGISPLGISPLDI
jgi:hypothetical protein